ncbi:GTP 3',8-cyclase MoaA [Ignatzschineria ureiclastica]|uniref:GTP 3',8-cyclase n=1 Tax=Ignatzschineria ureiclastica TaxID=472582 RepID=A0A2U2ACI9_9GAMM|nr:GTP 3',8-cyclase MoaA [Ignatzschineria ureiclastica]PWD80382.1 GTP 3',8-cyclase MoaA [Ignatzschineria ureiclastica]GGZ99918.1 GTP 3',8-cyclase [Ignatzschineria ureiclastica]
MLIDQFGRKIDYVRISVTDRCDLRCTYCIPKGFKGFEVNKNWLTFDEIMRVVTAFSAMGTDHYRITGGEPLLRKDVTELIARMAAIPTIKDLSMTTNATQLERHAKALKEAGLNRLNISLDSINPLTVHQITGNDCIEKVQKGIFAAKEAGFETIKINMVPMIGVNDQDIDSMIQFCMDNGLILRLIEAMPMGVTGQQTQGDNLTKLLETLRQKYGLIDSTKTLGQGPARYYESPDGKFTMGLITPMSQHFCDTCNRVRLAVDGTLYMCLGQEEAYPLREMLRDGCSDEELHQAIRKAIDLKPQKHEFRTDATKIKRIMSMTGG